MNKTRSIIDHSNDGLCYEENGEGGFTSDLSTSVFFSFFASFLAFLISFFAEAARGRHLKRKVVDKNRMRCLISEPHWLVCISFSSSVASHPPSPPPRSRQLFVGEAMNAEKFEGNEGWRTLWIAIAGVLAITLTWNVLMLSLNGMSY